MNSNSVNMWIMYPVIPAVLPHLLLYNSSIDVQQLVAIFIPHIQELCKSLFVCFWHLWKHLNNDLFKYALVSQIIHIHLNLLIHEMHVLNNADTTIIHFLYSKNLNWVILMLTPKPTSHFLSAFYLILLWGSHFYQSLSLLCEYHCCLFHRKKLSLLDVITLK